LPVGKHQYLKLLIPTFSQLKSYSVTILDFIESLKVELDFDEKQVYLTGFSQRRIMSI
jgi:predicted esterase